MTTANELYARSTSDKTTKYLPLHTLVGCYYNFIPEVGLESYELNEMASPLVEVRNIFDFDFDYRRIWRLSTVWFEGSPVMIVQNAGREGDDHSVRFITDEVQYRKMIEHIIALKPVVIEEVEDIISADEDMGDKLTRFYGNELDGHFARYTY
jgi:hypothetical protein